MNQYNLINHAGNQYWYLDTNDRTKDVLSFIIDANTLRWHRLDGPAVTWPNGHQEWWVNGEKHRLDGPAVIHPITNYQAWYLNNKPHRLDGPAYIYADGSQGWFVNGQGITNEYDLSLFDSEEGRLILILKYGNPV